MTAEHTGEQKVSPVFSLRIQKEKEKADEQIRLARKTGNFQDFIDSSLVYLDRETPGLAGIIKDAMDRQKSPELREDMFVTMWRYATVTRVLREELSQPKQPATTG